MQSNNNQGKNSSRISNAERVIVRKKTSIKTFTPEEELDYLVKRGDWELVLTSPAFKNRGPEAGAQLIRETIDNRMNQLGKTLNYLVNRGAEYHAAAMGVLERMQEMRRIRDDILKKIYEQYPRTISDKAGQKVDFY